MSEEQSFLYVPEIIDKATKVDGLCRIQRIRHSPYNIGLYKGFINFGSIMRNLMKVTQMTNEHLINRIRFMERRLLEKPSKNGRMSDSEFANDAMEQEDRLNDELEEKIINHIKYLKSLAKSRNLVI